MADQCLHCKIELPENHEGPCPECGKIGQIKYVKARNATSETVVTRPVITVSRIHTFFTKCWPLLIMLIVVGVVSPLITAQLSGSDAIIVGLALNTLSFILGCIAYYKVVKTETR